MSNAPFNFSVVSNLMVEGETDKALNLISEVVDKNPMHPAFGFIGTMFSLHYKHKKPDLYQKFEKIIVDKYDSLFHRVEFYGEKNIEKFFGAGETQKESELYRIESASTHFCPRIGILYDSDRNLCFSRGYFNREDKNFKYFNGYVWITNSNFDQISRDYPCYAGVHPHSFNFSHFLIRTLPQMNFLHNKSGLDDKIVYLRSDFDTGNFTPTILDLLSIPVSRMNLLHRQEPIVKSPSFSYIKQNNRQVIEIRNRVRSCVRNNFTNLLAQFRRWDKLYFIRENRGVTNQDEVVNLLKRRGYRIVNPGSLHPLEQVAMVMNAKSIVAPHGPALANGYWTNPGTQIVELMNPGDAHFRGIRDMLKLMPIRYTNLIGEPRVGFGREDYSIDLDKLSELIDQND